MANQQYASPGYTVTFRSLDAAHWFHNKMRKHYMSRFTNPSIGAAYDPTKIKIDGTEVFVPESAESRSILEKILEKCSAKHRVSAN